MPSRLHEKAVRAADESHANGIPSEGSAPNAAAPHPRGMHDAPLLRTALRVNALFSAASGALGISSADDVARSLSLPEWAITELGLVLMGYGVGLAVLSFRRRVASAWVVAAVLLDFVWVAGSGVFLALREVRGPLLVVAPALIVLVFALLQLEGLRRTAFSGESGHFTLERLVHANSERAWAVISDVARFADVAGTLHRSEIVSGAGVGMVRKCEDTNGACWLETCRRWEPGKAYAFEVDTSAPSYPLPLKTMRGDFEVDPVDDGHSTIRIRFTFSARGGWITELLLGLTFALRGDAIVGSILTHWAARIESTSGVEGSSAR